MGHPYRGLRGSGMPATGGHPPKVDPARAPGVLVVPVRRWRPARRPDHGTHAHLLLTSGYLAGRVGVPDGVGAPMSTSGFDRDKITELLAELGRRLSSKSVAGRLGEQFGDLVSVESRGAHWCPYAVWNADASSQIPRREKSMGVRAMVRAASRPPPPDGNHQDSRGTRRVHLGGVTPRGRHA